MSIKPVRSRLLGATVILTIATQIALCSSDPLGGALRASLPFGTKGIVVPKRPALIAGLEHSFRTRQVNNATSESTTAGAPQPAAISGVKGILVSLTGGGASRNQQQQHTGKRQLPGSQQQVLYLDRKHQELLAANPNYAAERLLKRSDVAPNSQTSVGSDQQQSITVQRLLSQAQLLNQPQASNGSGSIDSSQSAVSARDQAQHVYRGYSLIEMEIRNEQDRRYVQDLYANLSAALNEQANRPQALMVSPYADIDFWSFKNGVNDHIDIMLSPRSRQFILNQLARAKIKHRVKIEDIQARLDQQQQATVPSSSHSSSSSMEQLQLSGRQSPNNAAPDNKDVKLDSRQDSLSSAGGGLSGASMNDSLFFENYQRLADINQYLESLVGRAREVARVQVIGRSSQGRYLRVLRLGYEQRDADGSTADEQPALSVPGEQSPLPSNHSAMKILDQFMRQHQSVRKLGSIWLDGGTHAREWISPSTVLYMAFRLTDNHARCQRFFDHLRQAVQQNGVGAQTVELSARRQPPASALLDSDLLSGIEDINSSLLGSSAAPRQRARTEFEQRLELLAKRPQEVASGHGCDLELEQLLRRYTFFIEPVINPDGYEYSHTHNRLWRKTRSTSNHPIYRHFCLGADPNRNYDARHGSTGSSSHPCSQTYGGATPFTEPETRHQSNFVYAHRANMKMYISFHSYSQMILLPYSHSKQLAPDHKDLESVGQAAVKAIERTHGTQYRVGPSASILYTASGTASDWAYEKAGIKYSYTIELRDTGAYGFLLPKQQIIPTGEETFNGLLAMIGQMEKNDNLLSSKSSLVGMVAPMSPVATGFNTSAGQPVDFVHAPDLDQLRPFGRFRPRPAQLENALDGSDTWATPEPRPPGVRDRKPLSNSLDESIQANRLDEEADSLGFQPLEKETVSTNEHEPDAGLTFEGEGELMEPTDLAAKVDELVASRATRNAAGASFDQLSHRDNTLTAGETDGRLGAVARQTLGLSSSGRSLINNPLRSSRTERHPTRRESSESMRAANQMLL